MMNTPLFERLTRFATKPWRDKFRSFGFRWIRYLPGIPLPLRLPFGAWWLAENDFAGAALLEGRFEDPERAFVARFLKPGMTVLDIGAHKGLYSLISAFKIGSSGRVYAFEPSPRERKRLNQHIRLNRCRNVCVFDFALGESEGDADLFVVQGTETGCNSLRRPDVAQPVRSVRVPVKVLDEVLREQKILAIDFIKLDVEGAERDVLKGAEKLLERQLRPVIFAEVQDLRTEPWGYPAKEIIEHLLQRNYRWFKIDADGWLQALDVSASKFDGNFVACPEERTGEVLPLVRTFDR
ncbi:MAG TPA: FkbM family methyltransferase [Candidatus Binatus sp.]|jgi:FkbM family methyltransferase|nr:FkbM family methyltransferase [Candidatus Binatus sp.]